MKRKIFYTLHRHKKSVIAVKCDGFKIKRNGIKLYIYEDEGRAVRVIDPKTGHCIHSEYNEVKDIIIPKQVIKDLKQFREKEDYAEMQKIFHKCRKAAKLYEQFSGGEIWH